MKQAAGFVGTLAMWGVGLAAAHAIFRRGKTNLIQAMAKSRRFPSLAAAAKGNIPKYGEAGSLSHVYHKLGYPGHNVIAGLKYAADEAPLMAAYRQQQKSTNILHRVRILRGTEPLRVNNKDVFLGPSDRKQMLEGFASNYVREMALIAPVFYAGEQLIGHPAHDAYQRDRETRPAWYNLPGHAANFGRFLTYFVPFDIAIRGALRGVPLAYHMAMNKAVKDSSLRHLTVVLDDARDWRSTMTKDNVFIQMKASWDAFKNMVGTRRTPSNIPPYFLGGRNIVRPFRKIHRTSATPDRQRTEFSTWWDLTKTRFTEAQDRFAQQYVTDLRTASQQSSRYLGGQTFFDLMRPPEGLHPDYKNILSLIRETGEPGPRLLKRLSDQLFVREPGTMPVLARAGGMEPLRIRHLGEAGLDKQYKELLNIVEEAKKTAGLRLKVPGRKRVKSQTADKRQYEALFKGGDVAGEKRIYQENDILINPNLFWDPQRKKIVDLSGVKGYDVVGRTLDWAQQRFSILDRFPMIDIFPIRAFVGWKMPSVVVAGRSVIPEKGRVALPPLDRGDVEGKLVDFGPKPGVFFRDPGKRTYTLYRHDPITGKYEVGAQQLFGMTRFDSQKMAQVQKYMEKLLYEIPGPTFDKDTRMGRLRQLLFDKFELLGGPESKASESAYELLMSHWKGHSRAWTILSKKFGLRDLSSPTKFIDQADSALKLQQLELAFIQARREGFKVLGRETIWKELMQGRLPRHRRGKVAVEGLSGKWHTIDDLLRDKPGKEQTLPIYDALALLFNKKSIVPDSSNLDSVRDLVRYGITHLPTGEPPAQAARRVFTEYHLGLMLQEGTSFAPKASTDQMRESVRAVLRDKIRTGDLAKQGIITGRDKAMVDMAVEGVAWEEAMRGVIRSPGGIPGERPRELITRLFEGPTPPTGSKEFRDANFLLRFLKKMQTESVKQPENSPVRFDRIWDDYREALGHWKTLEVPRTGRASKDLMEVALRDNPYYWFHNDAATWGRALIHYGLDTFGRTMDWIGIGWDRGRYRNLIGKQSVLNLWGRRLALAGGVAAAYGFVDTLTDVNPMFGGTGLDEGVTVALADQAVRARMAASYFYDITGVTSVMRYMEGLMPTSSKILPGAAMGFAMGGIPGMIAGGVLNAYVQPQLREGPLSFLSLIPPAAPFVADLTKTHEELKEIYRGDEWAPVRRGRGWPLGCLAPETIVQTDYGEYKQASEVVVGDTLVTMGGKGKAKREVTHVIPRQVKNEPMYTIKTRHSYKKHRFTGNHPVLVYARQKNSASRYVWKRVDELEPGDRLVYKIPFVDYRPKRLRLIHYIPTDNVLINGEGRESTLTYLQHTGGGGWMIAPSSSTVPGEILADEELGLLCGWFAAEGNLSYDSKNGRAGTVEFTLNKNELPMVERIQKYIGDVWNGPKGTIVQKSKGCIRLRVSFQFLAEFLHSVFIKDGDKLIPAEILSWGKPFVRGFLFGIFYGDGHIQNNKNGHLSGIILTSAREQFILQTWNMLLSVGVFGYISDSRAHNDPDHSSWRIFIPNGECEEFIAQTGFYKEGRTITYPNIMYQRIKGSYRLHEGKVHQMVESVTHEQYSGTVYDFTVKGTHNFATAQYIVHNSQPIEGGRPMQYRPNWYPLLKAQVAASPALYGSKLEQFLFKDLPLLDFSFGDIIDPHYLERCVIDTTPIRISDGSTKQAGQIQVGDEVYGADGKFHPVLDKWVDTIKEDFIRIYPAYTSEPIYTTPEHKYLAVKSEKCHYRLYRGTPCFKKEWSRCEVCRDKHYKDYSAEWIRADQLTDTDYLAFPKPLIDASESWTKPFKLPLPKPFRSGKQLRNAPTEGYLSQGRRVIIDSALIPDFDFGYFLGLVLAEGSLSDKTTKLSFNINEISLHKWVVEYANNVLGLRATSTATPEHNRTDIFISNVHLTRWLKTIIGSGAHDKNIPPSLTWTRNLELLRGLVAGYLLGDGCTVVHPNTLSFSSCNRSLLEQIQFILLRLSVIASLKSAKNGNWILWVHGRDAQKVRSWTEEKIGAPARPPQWYWEDEDYYYIRVRSVRTEHMTANIVDLKVKDSHSFAGELCIFHNTHMQDRPYPEPDIPFQEIPLLGPALGATLGRAYLAIHPLGKLHSPARSEAIEQLEKGVGFNIEEGFGPKYGGAFGKRFGEGDLIHGTHWRRAPVVQSAYSIHQTLAEQVYKGWIEPPGLLGWTTSAALWGGDEPYTDEPVFATAANMDSFSRRYWDLQLGDPLLLCFVAGTKVLTSDGHIPIEEVEPGMKVLSRDGQFHRVIKTHVRPMDPDDILHKIEIGSISRTITATGNHRFLSCPKESCSDKTSDRLCIHGRPDHQCSDTCYRSYNGLEPEWVPVKNLRAGDLVVVPILKTAAEGDEELTINLGPHASIDTNNYIHKDHYFVRIKSSEILNDRVAKLYDLHVEGQHNYTAEGIIVHNSEGIRRLIPRPRTSFEEVNPLRNKMPHWTPESLKFGDPYCLSPETMVETEFGLCRADRVQEGDLIRTRYGRYFPVSKVAVREVDETVYRIKTAGMSHVTTVTAEHPFLIEQKPYHIRKWVQAANLSEGDYVVYPLLMTDKPVGLTLKNRIPSSEGGLTSKLPINSYTMFILAMMLKYGRTAGYKVYFSQEIPKESEERLHEAVQRLIGQSPRHNSQERSYKHRALAELQTLVSNHNILPALYYAPLPILVHFLKEFVSEIDTWDRVATLSFPNESAAYQVWSALLQRHVVAQLDGEKIVCPNWHIHIYSPKKPRKIQNRLLWSLLTGRPENEYTTQSSEYFHLWLDENQPSHQEAYFKIEKIEEIHYKGPVYGYQVDIDDTFCVAGCVVHNTRIPMGEALLPGPGYESLIDVKVDFPTGGSRLGYTAYEQALNMIGLQDPLEEDVEETLETGTAIHRMVQASLTRAGVASRTEALVFDPYNRISSYVDAVMRAQNGQEIPLEIKTINARGFQQLDKPKHKHLIQINSYMNMMKAPRGSVLYINREDPTQTRIFDVRYDPKLWVATLEELEAARSYARSWLEEGYGTKAGGYSYLDRLQVLMNADPFSKEYREVSQIVDRQRELGMLSSEEEKRYERLGRWQRNMTRRYEMYPLRFGFNQIIDPDPELQQYNANELIKAAADYGPLSRLAGNFWEKFTHLKSPLHSKLIATYSPEEQYERMVLYGSSFYDWTKPIDTMIKPWTRGLRSVTDPVQGAISFGIGGGVFGGPPGMLLGGAAGMMYGTLHGLYRTLTNTQWIPRHFEEMQEVQQYFDRLKYQQAQYMWQATKDPEYLKQMQRTAVGWVADTRRRSSLNKDMRDRTVEKETMALESTLLTPLARLMGAEARTLSIFNQGTSWSTLSREANNPSDWDLSMDLGFGSPWRGLDTQGDLTYTAANIGGGIAAAPYWDRPFFTAFLNVPENQQERVLQMVDEDFGEMLKAAWRRGDVEMHLPEDYFESHYIPPSGHPIYLPTSETDDWKYETVERHGLEAHEFGLGWRSQIRRINQAPWRIQPININAETPDRQKQDLGVREVQNQVRKAFSRSGLPDSAITIGGAPSVNDQIILRVKVNREASSEIARVYQEREYRARA